MERSGWRRPSPALLVACLALFVALGGTVLAATKIDGRTIRVKSLPGNRLEVGSVPGNRLQPGTIPGSRLARRSVKGDRIDIATLGQVPNADHADSADNARRAQTAIAAEHAADATTINGRSVGCASGKREFAGACWDLETSHAALNVTEAAAACVSEGGELPGALAFVTFAKGPGIKIDLNGEWTDDVGSLGAPRQYTVVYLTSDGAIDSAAPGELRHFRCVTPLLG
jgi:hypothetical protein